MLGMSVNHEFTTAVITVILFRLRHDFWKLPWFRVTVVIITKIYTISTSKRSILC